MTMAKIMLTMTTKVSLSKKYCVTGCSLSSAAYFLVQCGVFFGGREVVLVHMWEHLVIVLSHHVC